jgi:multidrug efflux pump subunit AcrB
VPGLGAGQESRLRAAFDHGFDAFRKCVGRAADAAIRWRYGVLGLVLAVLLGSVGFVAGAHIGAEAMPDIDGDLLEARILMPQGTPLERTEAVAREVEAALRRLDARLTPQQPNGAALVEAIPVRFNHNPSAREAGAHLATVMVDLLTAERRRIGLVPLLAETSTQAAAVKPLVISVVFGLLSATVQVVLVIPALYVLLDDWGWARVPRSSAGVDLGSDRRPHEPNP